MKDRESGKNILNASNGIRWLVVGEVLEDGVVEELVLFPFLNHVWPFGSEHLHRGEHIHDMFQFYPAPDEFQDCILTCR